MSATFEPGNLVGKSFELFKENVGPLLGGWLIMVVIVSVVGSFSMGIGTYIIIGPLSYGIFKISLDIVRGKSPEISELFSGFQVFLPAFLVGLLVAIFSTVGFILCVLPGLFVALIYLPVYCFLIDGEQNFWEAMEKSRVMVMNNLGPWVVLFLIITAINIVGSLLCGLGLLVTLPMTGLMVAMAYEAERGSVAAAPAGTV